MKEIYLNKKEQEAYEMAQALHEGVFRKFSGVPYFYHVFKVFKYVKKIDKRTSLGIAALLHDVIEDCFRKNPNEGYRIIEMKFGKEVRDLVEELTSIGHMVRLMGKADYLLDKMINMSDDALIIKLCDRLQNISDHYNSDEKFREKYYKETRYIIDNLRKNRQLNRKQITAANQIEGVLMVMEGRYDIEPLGQIYEKQT
jgi:(p)ppGpp synthase/HD superfamily hydrolase